MCALLGFSSLFYFYIKRARRRREGEFGLGGHGGDGKECSGWEASAPERNRSSGETYRAEPLVRSGRSPDRTFGGYRRPKIYILSLFKLTKIDVPIDLLY